MFNQRKRRRRSPVMAIMIGRSPNGLRPLSVESASATLVVKASIVAMKMFFYTT